MADALPDYKSSFLRTCLSCGCLTFGNFTLKSGRQSPYFINFGLFHSALLIRSISTAFASTLASHKDLAFDVLFGPAYKGIPLAATTVDKLVQTDEQRYGAISYSFNRKEAKDHGEGGSIVGAGLKGKRVVVIDDVITAGTAIREAIGIIEKQGGELVGIVVAFDRQERLKEEENKSTIGELRRQYGIPVLSILCLDDMVEGMKGLTSEEDLRRLEEYKSRYQAND